MYHNIFDSHSHYDAPEFDADREELLKKLPSQGIRGIMTAADTLESAGRAQKIAEQYEYVFFSAGIHPHEAQYAPENLEEQIIAFATDHKMKAVGEIGLDYHYDYSPREVQKEIFIRQIAVAQQLDLPVIIHNREAHGDTLDILRQHKVKGIIHSFSGSVEMAEELLSMGFYLGFTGVVTFKNARRPVEAVEAIPLNRLLVETDCPYMAPVPVRGRRSDSSMIEYTAQKMASIKGIGTQELLDATFSNACKVYNIKEESLKSMQ